MRRLEKFLAKVGSIEFNGEQFNVPPLKIKDLPLLEGAYKGGKVDTDGFEKLILKYLTLNFPEETEETLLNSLKGDTETISFGFLMKFMEKVQEVNGLEEDERIQRIKEKIAARQ